MDGVQDERCFNASVRIPAGSTWLAGGGTEEAAYGEVVWAWHPLLMSSPRSDVRANRFGSTVNPRDDGDKKEFVAGASTKEAVKSIRVRECRAVPVDLW